MTPNANDMMTIDANPGVETTNRSQSHQGGAMKSIILIVVVICLGCSMSGCGGYNNPNNNSQPTLSLAGNWQFTYTSSKGGTSTVSGTLTQTGSSFSGSVTITNSCATTGTLSGTISGTSVTGTLTEGNPETISITGNVATNYGSANGTYQVMSATGICAAASGDSGTWTGTHTTNVSGNPYTGMVRPADRMPVQLTLNLKEDTAGQVSGTATFTNSACLHLMSVAGTLSGINLQLQGDGGTDGSVVLSGTTDSEGKTITMNSTVSGPCQAESGAGTLTKMQ